MNFPLLVARRYLFAKRSTNAINIITGISVFGLSIGAAALLLVLSVFNGFEDLLSGLFGHFNPPLKITPAKGKTFEPDSLTLEKLLQMPGVLAVGESLEEIAFFRYGQALDFGVLKGVDERFAAITHLDSTLLEGDYRLKSGGQYLAVVGAGIRNKLSINIQSPLNELDVYMPADKPGLLPSEAFKMRVLNPIGTFAIQQEFDNQYIITHVDFVRELLGVSAHTVSALEVRLQPGVDEQAVKQRVRALLGPDLVVRDQYEQNEAFFKIMRLEKWISFAVTCLMLVLMAFNLTGALWMIVLDKQQDISVLKSMGAGDRTVYRIFLYEGMLLAGLGLLTGVSLGLLVYWLQKNIGLVSIPAGFLVDTYPIAWRPFDLLPVSVAVFAIGLLASLAPAHRASRVPAFWREE